MRFNSIGIELEGGLSSSKLGQIRGHFRGSPYYSDGEDGSVSVGDADNGHIPDWELRFWNEDEHKVYDFIKYAFNMGLKQNETCGNHLHYKFKDMEGAIALLTHKKTWDSFLKLYKTKFKGKKYEGRIHGDFSNHSYSKAQMVSFLNKGELNRYRSLNLMSIRQHGTIEIRVLPYVNSAIELIRSVKKMNSIVNTITREFVCSNIVKIEGGDKGCVLPLLSIPKSDLVRLDTQYSLIL